MQEQRIRLVIADDQRLMRAGLRTILESTSDIEVVGEAEDGVGAIQQVEALQPDVILMDIRMPLCDGIEATRILRQQPTTQATHILLLTTFDTPEQVMQGMRSGASGYLLKDCSAEELCHAVRTVARGQVLLDASSAAQLFSSASSKPEQIAQDEQTDTQIKKMGITPRELDVLRLIVQGQNNTEIAKALCISDATIKTHINHLFAKLGARDRAQVIVLAQRYGLQ